MESMDTTLDYRQVTNWRRRPRINRSAPTTYCGIDMNIVVSSVEIEFRAIPLNEPQRATVSELLVYDDHRKPSIEFPQKEPNEFPSTGSVEILGMRGRAGQYGVQFERECR